MLNPNLGRVLSAVGAVLLIVTLFVVWYDIDRTAAEGTTTATGWESFPRLRIAILLGAVLTFITALPRQTRPVLVARTVLGLVVGALIMRRIVDPPDLSAAVAPPARHVAGLPGRADGRDRRARGHRPPRGRRLPRPRRRWSRAEIAAARRRRRGAGGAPCSGCRTKLSGRGSGGERVDDGVLLGVGHAGEQRQRHRAGRVGVGERQLRRSVGVDREAVGRRVVQARLDAALLQRRRARGRGRRRAP